MPTEKSTSSTRGLAVRLASSRVMASAVSAVWMVLMVRRLEVSEFAGVASALALSAMTTLVDDAGQTMALKKYTGRFDHEDTTGLRLILKRRLLLCIAGATFLVVTYGLLNDGDFLVGLALVPSLFATVVYTTIFAYERSRDRVAMESNNELISRVALLVIGAGALQVLPDTWMVLALYSLVDVISCIVVWTLRKASIAANAGPPDRPDLQELSLRNVFPLSVLGAMGVLLVRLDPVFLGWLSDDRQLSAYAVGYRMVEVGMVPVGALIAVSIARFSRSGRSGARDTLRPVLALVGPYAVVVGAAFFLLARPFMAIFGEAYESNTDALRVLAVAFVPMAIAAGLIGWMAIHAAKNMIVVFTIALVVAVIGNLLLTPEYGARGAAMASVITQVTMVVVSLVAIGRVSRSEAA